MRAELFWRQHARVTLETTAPLSIGAGRGDGVFDVSVARDANGLPFIPGAALAGVLRAGWREHYGEDPIEIFGTTDTHASRVTLSSGHIHDARNRPVDALIYERALLLEDPLLGPLLSNDLPHRDHVALDHRGSAKARGKFDRTFVPVGHRFTFDLVLESSSGDDNGDGNWERMLALLGSPGFRLGGATRRSYGALNIHSVLACEFDLRSQMDRLAYASLSSRLDEKATCQRKIDLPALAGEVVWEKITISLQPEDFWRSGNGGHSFSKQKKLPDALPYSERRLDWQGDAGRMISTPEVILPGSAIKGALAHRLAFHHRRLTGKFGGPVNDAAAMANPAVALLFGEVNDEGGGQAGHILIDDIRVSTDDLNFAVMQHTSLDRFTGGVRQGVLYSEELVCGMPIQLQLAVRHRAIEALDESVRPAVLGALRATLADLCEGRLALGAAQAKGHGFFNGTIETMPQWLMEESK